ncbi:MAG: cobalamin biosynthesis protein, partial [Magnetococcales bacterium]|nr:cobalamin biosynthesis protein [Magnetococcales bacterium]
MFFLTWVQMGWALPLGLALDHLLGELPRFHPLVGFGRLAGGLERRLNPHHPNHTEVLNPTQSNALNSTAPTRSAIHPRLAGLVALLLLVILPTLLIGAAHLLKSPIDAVVGALLLYLALGGRSLVEHADWISQAMAERGLEAAREKVGWIVSRDTSAMTEEQVARGALESLLENGHDAIFATLFWFLLAGAPGAVLHRLVNTLDAMWGYRSNRYRHFGWAAARLDDVMGWIPARLTALTYLAAASVVGGGRPADGVRAWQALGPWK